MFSAMLQEAFRARSVNQLLFKRQLQKFLKPATRRRSGFRFRRFGSLIPEAIDYKTVLVARLEVATLDGETLAVDGNKVAPRAEGSRRMGHQLLRGLQPYMSLSTILK